MRRNYERPRIVVDQNLAEGVYLASGQKTGSLDVSYLGAMDKWNGGGKGAETGLISLGVHLNHGTSIDDLNVIDYDYTVS